MSAPPRIDVVVVAYNSADTLRACVQPLCDAPGVRITIVDNDSPEDSLGVVADLPVRTIHSGRNGGFAFGCNVGIAAGDAPYVLLLNPDASLTPGDLEALAAVLDARPGTGLVGPRLLDDDGELMFSRRRFPRARSALSEALFLHRLAPRALWADELVRRHELYDEAGTEEWVSGACMLIRRDLLARLGGLDEGFFLYCEDTDLCRRIWDLGFEVRYEPRATARHHGGHSAPRSGLLPVLAESRLRYARKHAGRVGATAQAAAIALHAATHWLAAARRPAHARGHAAALKRVRAAWFAASSHPT